MIDELLKKAGLKYEDLNVAEKETLNSMLDSLTKTKLTIDKLKEYLANMRYGVEQELANEPEHKWIFFRNDKNLLLKARLRNYMLLEGFLMSPEKAKEALERALAGMVVKK
jgi:hypothetical protein